jgi:tryptophan synthase alpha chain
MSRGFIYYVSLTGVTGAKLATGNSIKDSINRIKAVTDKPIAVGFGISTPDQAANVARAGADGVIVGSALVKVIEEYGAAPGVASAVAASVEALKQGVLAGRSDR